MLRNVGVDKSPQGARSQTPTASTITKWVLARASAPETACRSVGEGTRVPRLSFARNRRGCARAPKDKAFERFHVGAGGDPLATLLGDLAFDGVNVVADILNHPAALEKQGIDFLAG